MGNQEAAGGNEYGEVTQKDPIKQLQDIAQELGYELTEIKKGTSTQLGWKDFEEIDSLRFFPGNPPIYEVIKNGASIEMRDKEILTQTKFRLEVLAEFRTMLPPIKPTTWAKLVSIWTQEFREDMEEMGEEIGEEQSAAEIILELIESSTVVDSLEKTLTRGFVFKRGPAILMPSEVIQKELDKRRNKTSLRMLSHKLRDHLMRGSKTENVNLRGRKNMKKRFWYFRASRFPDLEKEEPVSLEDDNGLEEEGGGKHPNQRNLRWAGNGQDNEPAGDNGG